MLVFNAGNSVVCIPSFILFEKTNRGRMVVLCVVLLLLHYGVIWFYHGLNSVAAMLLFTISSAAQKSDFGTGFYGYLIVFSA